MGGENIMIASEALQGQQATTDFLASVRLRAQRRVLWLQTLWSEDIAIAKQSLAISATEVDRILIPPPVMAEAEAAFYQSDRTAQEMTQQLQVAEEQLAHDQNWQGLRQLFGLSDRESDLLLLAIAVEVDPLLRRVYGYLHDDATMGYATPWLASLLFQWNAASVPGPESGLRRWRLAVPAEGQQHGSIASAWVADPYIVGWLVQGQRLDPMLGTAVQWIPATPGTGQTCLYPAELAAMREFIVAIAHTPPDHPEALPSFTALELELIAPEGAGKRTLAAQVCGSLGVSLLVADSSLLLGAEVSLALAAERVLRVLRSARLNRSIPYWHRVEDTNPKVWRSLRDTSQLTIFGATAPLGQRHNGALRRVVSLPSLTRKQRLELWQQLTNGSPVPDPVLNWVLTPGEITEAARAARAGTAAVVAVCQQMVHHEPGELFNLLICPYTWEDIVLPSAIRQHLEELEQQARLRWQVYEEWGFERLCPVGRGITAMFAGPSGTGKTMAAQVLARSLGMELYRVDLAGVVNKYIGETEKRLKRVFDACERANVVLFFDEADALFGQRTQVKDAHDRFANIEIDYLLQRMEQFDGIAILATNRKGDMDQAFIRRLRFIVDFIQPGPTERLKIWKLALLERSPGGEALLENLDWQRLAKQLNMTGADIKGAALGAAFLARASGTRITMQHLFHAAQREMAKHGIVIRAGEWEG